MQEPRTPMKGSSFLGVMEKHRKTKINNEISRKNQVKVQTAIPQHLTDLQLRTGLRTGLSVNVGHVRVRAVGNITF